MNKHSFVFLFPQKRKKRKKKEEEKKREKIGNSFGKKNLSENLSNFC